MKPERKNWCSGWPDAIRGKDYGECCRRHDLAYATPGTWLDRAQADWELRACVEARVGRGWARLMFIGVRAFGWTPWRFNRTIFGRKVSDEKLADLDRRLGGAADR